MYQLTQTHTKVQLVVHCNYECLGAIHYRLVNEANMLHLRSPKFFK